MDRSGNKGTRLECRFECVDSIRIVPITINELRLNFYSTARIIENDFTTMRFAKYLMVQLHSVEFTVA